MTTSEPDPASESDADARTPWGPAGALLATLLVLGCSFAVTILLTGVFLLALEGSASFLDPERLDHGTDPDLLFASFLALLAAQALTVLLIWVLASQRNGRRARVLFLRPPRPPLALAASGVGFTVTAAAIVYGCSLVWPYDLTEALRDFIVMAQSSNWPVVFLVMALGAAMSEELVFRGFLLSALAQSRMGPAAAAAVTSSLWTLIHWGYPIPALASLFALGLLLAALVWRTGSIWHAIVAHGTYNACAFAYLRWFVTAPVSP